MGFLPANFQLAVPSRPRRIGSGTEQTDRRTDSGRQCITGPHIAEDKLISDVKRGQNSEAKAEASHTIFLNKTTRRQYLQHITEFVCHTRVLKHVFVMKKALRGDANTARWLQ